MTKFNSSLQGLYDNYLKMKPALERFEKFQTTENGKSNGTDGSNDKKNLADSIPASREEVFSKRREDYLQLSKAYQALWDEKKLLKEKNLFDVDGNGKLSQEDIDMFLKSDVDGDGIVSEDEMNFISRYKDEMLEAMKKGRVDFEMDGKRYIKGQLAQGLRDGKLYTNGILATRTFGGSYYVNGELANGTYNDTFYVDGKKANGEIDGIPYKNGKVNVVKKNGAYYVGNQIANGTYNGQTYENGNIIHRNTLIYYNSDLPKTNDVNSGIEKPSSTFKSKGFDDMLNILRNQVNQNQLKKAQTLMSLMGATFNLEDRAANFKFVNNDIIYESNGVEYRYSPNNNSLTKVVKNKDGEVTEYNSWSVDTSTNPPKKELSHRIVNRHPETSKLQIKGCCLLNSQGEVLNLINNADGSSEWMKSVYVNPDGTLVQS